MMKCDILFFSDEFGFIDDQIWFHHMLEINKFDPTSITYITEFPTQDEIFGKDLVFIDFGGIPKGESYYSLLNRVENLIEFNHDKQFVFALTMPEWFYNSETLFNFDNVISFDKSVYENYNKAFDLFR